MPEDGGVDLTPIYRADAQATMVFGAVFMAGGAVACLFVGNIGFVLVAVGVARFLWGAYKLHKLGRPS